MDEKQDHDFDYQKGFNEGYVMKKYLPDLADKVAKAMDKSERGTGFQDGREQYVSEQQKNRYPTWLRGDRQSDAPDKSKEKGKEGPELER